MVTGGSFELDGRRFAVPVPIVGVAADGDRMVAGAVPPAEARQGDDLVVYDMSADAADLALAQSGRAPLLNSHLRTLDYLMGAITAAWIDKGTLYFAARLAPVAEADRLWTFIADGFPISVSLGAEVIAGEFTGSSPWGGQRIEVRRWRLIEISACVHGANSGAYMVRLGSPEGRALLATRKPADPGAIRERLGLDRWRRWAVPAGMRIAEELDVNRDRMCDALDREVAAHAERLVADLAL